MQKKYIQANFSGVSFAISSRSVSVGLNQIYLRSSPKKSSKRDIRGNPHCSNLIKLESDTIGEFDDILQTDKKNHQ